MSVADQRYPSLGTPELGAVDWFACDMKRKLEQHSSKGNRETWLDEGTTSLLKRAHEELDELEKAVDFCTGMIRMCELGIMSINEGNYMASLQNIIDEAADVGNFAMMIADKARSNIREYEQLRESANNKGSTSTS